MQRMNKAKDAMRRARKLEQKAMREVGTGIMTARVIPDKRFKPVKHTKPLREEY